MNALGKVVNLKTKVIHRAGCGMTTGSRNVKPLSTIPAPKRKGFGLCKVCKP